MNLPAGEGNAVRGTRGDAQMSTLTSERNRGVDLLRFIMIVCVVAMHGAMSFMQHVPPWWYVIDPRQSLGFTFFVVIIDTFPMAVLFFLAGYFTPASLAAKGPALFIQSKVQRLALPWLLGVVFIGPCLAQASIVSLGFGPLPIADLLSAFFIGENYQQGPFWFLGVLFFFMTAYAARVAFLPARSLADKAPMPAPENKPDYKIALTIVFILSSLSYALSSLHIAPVDGWIDVGRILFFQPARIVGYAAFFLLGAYASQKNWFRSEGWRPNIVVWGVLTLFSFLLKLMWAVVPSALPSFTELHPLQAALCGGAAYTLSALSATLFFVGAFSRINSAIPRIFRFFIPYSFGIYWLHMAVQLPLLQLCRSIELPTAVLWLGTLCLTLCICSALTAGVLKKTPILRHIF